MESLPRDVLAGMLRKNFTFAECLRLRRVCRVWMSELSGVRGTIDLRISSDSNACSSFKRTSWHQDGNVARLTLGNAQSSHGRTEERLRLFCLSFHHVVKFRIDASLFSDAYVLGELLRGLPELSSLRVEKTRSSFLCSGIWTALGRVAQLRRLTLDVDPCLENDLGLQIGDANARLEFVNSFWSFLLLPNVSSSIQKLHAGIAFVFDPASFDYVLKHISETCPSLVDCRLDIPDDRNVFTRNQSIDLTTPAAVAKLSPQRLSRLKSLSFVGTKAEDDHSLPTPPEQLVSLEKLHGYYGPHAGPIFQQNPSLKSATVEFDTETLVLEKICLRGLGACLTDIYFFCTTWPPSTWRALGALQNLRKIQSLDVNDVHEECMKEWAAGIAEKSAPSKLEFVDHRFSSFNAAAFLRHVGPLVPSLRFLRVGSEGLHLEEVSMLSAMPFHLTEVAVLAMGNGAEFAEYLKSGKASELQNIRVMDIHRSVAQLNDELMIELAHQCRNLRVLRLLQVDGVSKEGWRACIDRMQNLQHLDVGSDTLLHGFDDLAPRVEFVIRPGPVAVREKEERRQAKRWLKQRAQEELFNQAEQRGAQLFEEHQSMMRAEAEKTTDKKVLSDLDGTVLTWAVAMYPREFETDVNPKGFRKGFLSAAKGLKSQLLKERFARRPEGGK